MGKTKRSIGRQKSKTQEYMESLHCESKETRHLLEKARAEYFGEIMQYVYTPTLQKYDKLNDYIEAKKEHLPEIIDIYNDITTTSLNGRDFHKCWELPEHITLRQFYDEDNLGEKYGIWNPNNDSQKYPLLFSDGFLIKLAQSKKAKIHHTYRQKMHLKHKKTGNSIDHIGSTFYICTPFSDPRKKALVKRCISWPSRHDKEGHDVEVEDRGSYEMKLTIDPMNINKCTFFDFIRYDHNPECIHSNKLDANNNLSLFPIELLDGKNASHLHINTQLFQALFPRKIASPQAILIDTKGLNYQTMINVLDFALGVQHEKPLIYDPHAERGYHKKQHDLPPSKEHYADLDIIERFNEVLERYQGGIPNFDERYYDMILKRDYPEIYNTKGNRLVKTILGRVAYGIDYYKTYARHPIDETKCHIGDLIDDRYVSTIPTPTQLKYTMELKENGKNTPNDE